MVFSWGIIRTVLEHYNKDMSLGERLFSLDLGVNSMSILNVDFSTDTKETGMLKYILQFSERGSQTDGWYVLYPPWEQH